jgi:hypothetical protein
MLELTIASFVSIGSVLISRGIEGFTTELGTSAGIEAAKQIRSGFIKCFNKIKSKLIGNPQAFKVMEDFEIDPENEENQNELQRTIQDLASKYGEIGSEISELVKRAESYGFKIGLNTKVGKTKTFTAFRESEIKSGVTNLDTAIDEAEEVTLFDKSKIGQ